jgi:hypothetical protein
MASVKILPTDLPEAIRQRRRETRRSLTLPLRLTSGSGETLPAVILNLSASGLLALVDVRFSPLLPPPPGSRFDGEFFLDEIEMRQAVLEVVRVEEQGKHLFVLGCKFVHPPASVPANIRASLATR